jgi:hypothetical protein
MRLTDYHAKYFAHELTKRCASDNVEKLAAVLADAQVDLNPHQVEAALFAFRSPFSKGAILADEVGLGKTIEAGLLLSQKWAERRRRLLIIVPANLRKQWSQELADKFYLPAVILESRSFNEAIRDGNLNPFQGDAIILCSYHFARNKEPYGRTLRLQVLEYVKYTNRHALVQEFVPTPEEQRLYDLVSDYLQRPTLFALPAGQRQLMTLILRKLLASSTYAISSTLDGLVQKLETAASSAEAVDSPPDDLPENLEELDVLCRQNTPKEVSCRRRFS